MVITFCHSILSKFRVAGRGMWEDFRKSPLCEKCHFWEITQNQWKFMKIKTKNFQNHEFSDFEDENQNFASEAQEQTYRYDS